MRKLPLSISSLIFLSSFAQAGIETDYPEVTETISTLGLELNDFSTLWPFYCNPKCSTITPNKSYNGSRFTRDTINKQFIFSEKKEDNIKLSTGKKCKALNEYYFHNKNSSLISEFIKKDKLIRKKYGYSSIDLYKYSYNFQGNFTTYNPTPGYKKLVLKLINYFKNQNIFVVKEIVKNTNYKKIADKFVKVKVTPYSYFYVVPTQNFIKAHEILKLKYNKTHNKHDKNIR